MPKSVRQVYLAHTTHIWANNDGTWTFVCKCGDRGSDVSPRTAAVEAARGHRNAKIAEHERSTV